MRSQNRRTVLLATVLLGAARGGAAQGNPFALDLGPYKSVAINWSGGGPLVVDGRTVGSATSTAKGLLTPTALLMTSDFTVTAQGQTRRGNSWSLSTPEAEASDLGGTDTIRVEPSLRGLLAREFDALPATGRARLVANVRKLDRQARDELDVLPTFVGRKTGSATVAGMTCDVYAVEDGTVCVLPRAPAVALKFAGQGQSGELVASSVQFNVAVSPGAFAYPAGKPVARVSPQGFLEQGGWAAGQYAEHNDGNSPPSLEALAKFLVRYLASEDITEEKEEMEEEASDTTEE